jgi:hypothetical protein
MTRFILLLTVITTLTTCTAQQDKPESFSAQTDYEVLYVREECEAAKKAAYQWHYDARENRLTIKQSGKECLEIENPIVFFTTYNGVKTWQIETQHGRWIMRRNRHVDSITHVFGNVKFVYFSSEPKFSNSK